jgi:hypothetical protein
MLMLLTRMKCKNAAINCYWLKMLNCLVKNAHACSLVVNKFGSK